MNANRKYYDLVKLLIINQLFDLTTKFTSSKLENRVLIDVDPK